MAQIIHLITLLDTMIMMLLECLAMLENLMKMQQCLLR